MASIIVIWWFTGDPAGQRYLRAARQQLVAVSFCMLALHIAVEAFPGAGGQ